MTFVRGLQYDGEWKDDKAHGWVRKWASAGLLNLPAMCGQLPGRLFWCSAAAACPRLLPGARLMCPLRLRPPAAPCLCRQGAARYENGGVYVGEFAHDLRSGWGAPLLPPLLLL